MEEQFIDGMTVNERLFHFGLVDLFESAARSRDVLAMVQVLRQAQFSEVQASETARAVASDPARYGF
jgi:hypothetical protein